MEHILLLDNGFAVTSESIRRCSLLCRENLEVFYPDEEDMVDSGVVGPEGKIEFGKLPETVMEKFGKENVEVIDITGKYVFAGGIDAHVHFRDPGLTHKADFHTESLAALAGGVTTVMDMPNTNPPTISAKALKEKMQIAAEKSAVRAGFNIGATNSNADSICNLLENADPETGICKDDFAGIKIFMGSSTGNMLVDDGDALHKLFNQRIKPVQVHCEDEATIRENLESAKREYGNDIPFRMHPSIRSRSACIKSSAKALELAVKYGTRLTLCHISTKEELDMVKAAKLHNPDITAETSCNYLWFCDRDYDILGSRVKCNPSIKSESDREALRIALKDGAIDTIGSDHAPHLLSEKMKPYLEAPSGMPSIQQTLPVLLTVAKQEGIPLTRIASVFSEKASEIYGLKRGKILDGYASDLVVVDIDKEFTVRNEDQRSKCGWTPYDGVSLTGLIEIVVLNGEAHILN